MNLIQQLINGLALGSVYALIAIGYTMVYGIIGLINFAHGDIYMAGAFFGFFAATSLHLSFIPTLLVAMVGSAVLGVVIEKVAYKPLRNSPKITLLITAIGMSLLLENVFLLRGFAGPDPKSYPATLVTQKMINIGSLQINNIQLIILGICLVLVLILQYIVFYTKTGKAMRATSFDKDAALLMGININNIISITFAIGSALAGAAGVLIGIQYTISPLMGVLPGLKAFVAAVLGGIGVLPGALAGGLLLGLIETFSKITPAAKFYNAIVFGVLILILIFKPTGIFGKKTNEKV